MKKILNYKATKIVAFILCTMLPLAFLVLIFFGTLDNTIVDFFMKNIYNFLWCGLYGCVLICLISRKIWIKVIAVIANLLPFVFLAFGSLMGGYIWSFYFTVESNYSIFTTISDS